MRYSDDDLLDELHRLADELGHPPTLQDVRERGSYAATTYYNRFGSWRDALDAAGYEPREPESQVPVTDLIAELKQVAKEHGSPPSASDMSEHGEYWASTYRRRFGSWNKAVRAAGFDPTPESTKVSEEDLIAEIHRMTEELGEPPNSKDMKNYGQYDPKTYHRRFGSWSNAIDAALEE